MKIKQIKPITLKFKWFQEFKIWRMAIYVILITLAVTMYVAYVNSEAKIRDQDRKIANLYRSYINVVNLSIDTNKRLNSALTALKCIEEGHTKYQTKYGPILRHSPLDKQ